MSLLIKVLRWPIMVVVVAVLLAPLYRYGPSRARPKWAWVTWGSAFAAIAWLGVSLLFSWFTENFGSYNKTYGTRGAAIGFMVWMWLSTVVVLVGAQLDAEMEHQTARDSTEGEPKPMGARGARMADTVGARQE
jgi:membrane protein